MGLSFGKLFLLILVLAVVWFGWRYFRVREKEAEIAAERMRQGGVVKAALKEEAETMAPCRVCRAYVAANSAPCERADCPQRGR